MLRVWLKTSSEAGGGCTAPADRSLPGGHPPGPGWLHRPAEDHRIPRRGRTCGCELLRGHARLRGPELGRARGDACARHQKFGPLRCRLVATTTACTTTTSWSSCLPVFPLNLNVVAKLCAGEKIIGQEKWCMWCCRRRRLQLLQRERVGERWRRLLRHLRRLRRLQRVFAYSGHLLQHYPAGLRLRLRQLL